MAIPAHETMLRPMLALHADGLELERASIRAALTEHFHLSQDDLEEMIASGRQLTFHNRVNWAAVYLAQAGLLERPGRGRTKITPRGQEVLTRYPDRIDYSVLAQLPEFQDFLRRAKSPAAAASEMVAGSALPQATPEEAIEVAYPELWAALAEEVLGRVLASPPTSLRPSCWTCCWPWAMAAPERTLRNFLAAQVMRAWMARSTRTGSASTGSTCRSSDGPTVRFAVPTSRLS
jgi:restriction system protein